MTFTDFCSVQFLSKKDKELFEAWLKANNYPVDKNRTEKEWVALFGKWITSDFNMEPA